MKKIYPILFILLFSMGMVHAYLGDRLLSYYSMNSTDVSIQPDVVNGLNFVQYIPPLENITGNSKITIIPGKVGDAINFTQVSSSEGLVLVNKSINYTTLDNFSISVWFLSDSHVTTTNERMIYFSGDINSPDGASLFSIISQNGRIIVTYFDDITGDGISHNLDNGINYTDGQWHHLVVVKGDNISDYIDGVFMNTSNCTLSGPCESGISQVGNAMFDYLDIGGLILLDSTTPDGSNDFTSAFYNGAIDEVALWTRVLNSTEISTIYNAGSGLPYNSTNYPLPLPVCIWNPNYTPAICPQSSQQLLTYSTTSPVDCTGSPPIDNGTLVSCTFISTDTATNNGLNNAKNLIYAGLGVLAVLLLVIVAWGLIKIFEGGSVDFMTVSIAVIGGGVVIMLAYLIIWFVFKALGGV